jgi:hypothetical protein
MKASNPPLNMLKARYEKFYIAVQFNDFNIVEYPARLIYEL